MEWNLVGNTAHGNYMGGGWGNVRMIAGVAFNRFVAVKDNGELVEWNYNYTAGTYLPSPAGVGWQNARLIG